MSFAQERLWLVDVTAPGSPTYNVPMLVRWREPIDADALHIALDAVVARHEVLRTTYRLDGGRPVQVVADSLPVTVDIVDLAGSADPVREMETDAARRAVEPFDLAAGPPLRCTVWQGLPGGDALLLNVHHIAVDGWSLAPLFDDLTTAYDCALAGKPPELGDPSLQYADYAVWDREVFEDPELRRQLSERVAHLLEADEPLLLAGARPRSNVPEGARPGSQHVFRLSAGIRDQLEALARSLRATPFVVLFAAYQAVLHHWSGRERFLVGSITANRSHQEIENLVGFFVNTVPLHCVVDPGATFAELCARVRQEGFRALSYQRIPFDRLAAEAAAARAGGHRPLVNVAFSVQNIPLARAGSTRWEVPRILHTGRSKFDLLLFVEEHHDGLVGTVEYDTECYGADIAVDVADTFIAFVQAAVADPDTPLHQLLPGPPLLVAAPPTAAPTTAAAPAGTATAEPRLTLTEQWAARLFADALAEVGHGASGSAEELLPDGDFFNLGGHSLLAVTMLAEAQRRHGVAVSPRDFMTDPTVAGLGRLLDASPQEIASAQVAEQDRYPASSVQERFWFIDRIPSLRTAYLLPSVVEYTGAVDAGALRLAVDLVLARHPALRSRFLLDRELRRVFYRTDGPPATATTVDASTWPAEHVAERVRTLCWSGMDLTQGPPVRAEILTLGGRILLVLVAHHIVVDGWARQLLLDQIAEAYRAGIAGRAPSLPDPVHPAAMSAPAGREVDGVTAAEVVAGLTGAPTDVALPHDRPRGELQTTPAATLVTVLGPECTERLAELTAQTGTTTFMTAAVLLAVALARGGDQRDFVFAFPWAGRPTPQSAQAVAMCVNTLLLRVDLTGRPTWREALLRVREAGIRAYRNAEVPFDAVVAALHPARDLSRPPVTPVYLSFEDAAPEPPPLGPGTAARFLPLDPLHLKYELELTVTERRDGLHLAITYAIELFDETTVGHLLSAVADAALELVTAPDTHPL